jgi:hypothetical protein
MEVSEFWQALDIIHLWADSRKCAVTFQAKISITVTTTQDISKEAATLCNFLSMMTGEKWIFQTQKESNRNIFTTFAHSSPQAANIPTSKKPKKPEQGKLF